MAMKLPEPAVEAPQQEALTHVDDLFIEKLWHDLDGQVSREEIVRVINQIAIQFQDATVTMFVPLFVRRLALEQLKRRLSERSQCVASGGPTNSKYRSR